MAINTPLRQKRSESGEALVLTIAVIGLALIVTAAAFLLAARTGQDTERVASAKVDIATREDTLMRAILQETATGAGGGIGGIFPVNNVGTGTGLSWTPIIANAVNQVAATSYVDPNEVSALLGPGVIPANMGDPDGFAGLSIFQGYQQEVPYGGTTGVANLVTSYNQNVEPPELVWVSNANISATNAATNPLQFFLGSQVSATGSTDASLSPSGRWGQITYPNIRFGFMRPGDTMVARRVWWRIPVKYQTNLQTIEAKTAGTDPNVTRYPGMLANYILSVYEIPSQLPITGNANIQLGLNSDGSGWGNTSLTGSQQVQITGSIYGDSVQLNGGTYSGGISSRNQVSVLGSSSVAGEAFTDNTYNNLGVREQKDLTRPTTTAAIGAAPVSVAGDNGKVMLVPVASGSAFYLPSPNATPTAWDLYSLPYYHCRIRITISGTNGNLNYQNGVVSATAGAISVKIRYLPDTAQLPDAVFGVADSDAGWQPQPPVKYSQASNSDILAGGTSSGALTDPIKGTANFLLYTSTATGNSDTNVLEIDLLQMYRSLGLTDPNLTPASCYSIYIECPASQNPNNPNPQNLGIVIKDADDLTGSPQLGNTSPGPFTNGLSILSTQRIYLAGGAIQQTGLPGSGFNTVPWPNPSDPNNPPYPATSIYAPDVRYGITDLMPTITVTGQVAVSQATPGGTPVYPLSFSTGGGNTITGTGNSYKLNAVSKPRTSIPGVGLVASLPPITRLNLLFTVEKERTN
jgi:hypothetical protein